MTIKKKHTINKANEIIRGVDDYSLFGKRCLNALYYIYQFNYNRNKEIEKLEYIDIDFSFFRKTMNLEKVESYITIIQDALKELEKTIELNHFKNPLDRKEYVWYTDRLINRAGWYYQGNKKIARIELSRLAKYLMQKQTNFTKIELIEQVNKLRTKYGMKLYEYLSSFREYRYLDISQRHLMRLLGFEATHKTYKHYAKLKILLERQLKEIANKTDLTEVKLISNKELSKAKKYKILINPKANKNEAKNTQKILEQMTSQIRI